MIKAVVCLLLLSLAAAQFPTIPPIPTSGPAPASQLLTDVQGSWRGIFKAGSGVNCKSLGSFLGSGFMVSHYRNLTDNGDCQYQSMTTGILQVVDEKPANKQVTIYYSSGAVGGVNAIVSLIKGVSLKMGFFDPNGANTAFPASFDAVGIWTIEYTFEPPSPFKGSFATATGVARNTLYSFIGSVVIALVNNPTVGNEETSVYAGAISYYNMPLVYSGQTVDCALDLPMAYQNGKQTHAERQFCIIKYDATAKQLTIATKFGSKPTSFDDVDAHKTEGTMAATSELDGQWDGIHTQSDGATATAKCRAGFFAQGRTYWSFQVCPPPATGGLFIGRFGLDVATSPKHLDATQYLGLNYNQTNPESNTTATIKESYSTSTTSPTVFQVKVGLDLNAYPTDMSPPYFGLGVYTRYSDLYNPNKSGAGQLVPCLLLLLVALLF
jgi:hypothetical protein